MTEDPILRSSQNPTLKRVRGVRDGLEPQVMLLEGERLILDALESGAELESLLVEEGKPLARRLEKHPRLRRVVPGLLAGVSSLKASPGVLALAPAPRMQRAQDFAPGPDRPLLVLSGVSDPGNLGALLRVAEAAGAAAVAIARGSAHPFSPKALRGSMGSALRLPLLRLESASELERPGLRHALASTAGGQDFRRFDWRGPLCLWLPAETGAAALEPPAGAEPVSIPMQGRVESLNLATAGALLLFEAARGAPSGAARTATKP